MPTYVELCNFFIHPKIRKLIKAGEKIASCPEERMSVVSHPEPRKQFHPIIHVS